MGKELEEIERRVEHSKRKLEALRQRVDGPPPVESTAACAYVIGSYGRGEASEHSDLDLFLASRATTDTTTRKVKREFSQLEEIRLKAKLIDAGRSLALPEFSGDGEFLSHYTIDELVNNIGKREDDAENTFTARLLLLLESQPILNAQVYEETIARVLQAYWRNYANHEDDFVPGYLVNDILRLWRTFCVNYEAGTKEKPDPAKAKRQLKHYKLQHSRLLTCYSGLLYLLGTFARDGTVSLDAGEAMTKLTPLERLDWIAGSFPDAVDDVEKVKAAYASFLEKTSGDPEELLRRIMKDGRRSALPEQDPTLASTVFELINRIGGRTRLHQLIVV